MQRPESIFIHLLFFYSIGLIIAYSFPDLHLKHFVAIIGVLIFCTLLLFNLTYRFWRLYRFKAFFLPFFYLFAACTGCWCCLDQKQDLQNIHFSKLKSEKLKIRIDDEPQLKPGSVCFKAKVIQVYNHGKATPCTGKLLVYVKASKIQLAYGDELMIPAKFSSVLPPLNAFNFDFKAWLAMQNIYHQCYPRQFVSLRHNSADPLIAFALRLRKRQVEIYRRLLKDDEAFAVASTLILGYRADLSEETLSAYTKTGTVHALSVSGMHVGIIYIVLNWLLTFCNRKRLLKLFKTLLILFLIWFYSLLTGFSPSVLRSAIMLSVFIISKATGRKTNSYNILAFSAFCTLMYDPFLFFDVGFQLSYLSVFGLIYLQPMIFNWFSFKWNWCNKLWGILALSFAAQLTTFPLSIYYFHQFPVYFLFSNLFIMLPAALMMYLGLGILVFKLYFLASVFEWIIGFTNAGLKWISALPTSIVSCIWISKTELFLLSTGIALLILALRYYRKKLMYASLLLFLVLEGLMTRDKFIAHRQMEFIVFKLRKNSAAVYIKSGRAVLITDVAAEHKTFKFSIKPYLDAHRIKEISYLPINPSLPMASLPEGVRSMVGEKGVIAHQ